MDTVKKISLGEFQKADIVFGHEFLMNDIEIQAPMNESLKWYIVEKLIQYLDGSPFTHVAIYLDKVKPENQQYEVPLLGHAIRRGLKESYLDWDWNGKTHLFVKRFEKIQTADIDRIIFSEKEIMKSEAKYDYSQAVLAGLLCLTTDLNVQGAFRSLIIYTLEILSHFVEAKQGKELMTCSEFVYKCYENAGMNILMRSPVRQVGKENILDWALKQTTTAPIKERQLSIEEVNQRTNVLLFNGFFAAENTHYDFIPEVKENELLAAVHKFARIYIGEDRAVTLSDKDILLEFQTKLNANFVTPRSIYEASNLQTIGKWYGPNQ